MSDSELGFVAIRLLPSSITKRIPRYRDWSGGTDRIHGSATRPQIEGRATRLMKYGFAASHEDYEIP